MSRNNIFLFFVIMMFMFLLKGCSSGNCDYPDDRARDGSRCGDRAASVRPGGRNPDSDWVWWVVIVGGVFYYFVLKSDGSSSSGSIHREPNKSKNKQPKRPYNTEKPSKLHEKCNLELPTKTRNLSKTPPINNSLKDSSNIENHSLSPSYIEPEKVKVILRITFDQILEPYLQPVFDEICKQTENLGGTNYDAAARFILTNIGSYQDIPGDNITHYIDMQTRNLYRNMHRQTLHTDILLEGITIIRVSRGLSKLN